MKFCLKNYFIFNFIFISNLFCASDYKDFIDQSHGQDGISLKKIGVEKENWRDFLYCFKFQKREIISFKDFEVIRKNKGLVSALRSVAYSYKFNMNFKSELKVVTNDSSISIDNVNDMVQVKYKDNFFVVDFGENDIFSERSFWVNSISAMDQNIVLMAGNTNIHKFDDFSIGRGMIYVLKDFGNKIEGYFSYEIEIEDYFVRIDSVSKCNYQDNKYLLSGTLFDKHEKKELGLFVQRFFIKTFSNDMNIVLDYSFGDNGHLFIPYKSMSQNIKRSVVVGTYISGDNKFMILDFFAFGNDSYLPFDSYMGCIRIKN